MHLDIEVDDALEISEQTEPLRQSMAVASALGHGSRRRRQLMDPPAGD